MPQERLPKQALLAKVKGKRPVGRLRTRWADYIEDLGWNSLRLQPSEMSVVVADRDVWRLNLERALKEEESDRKMDNKNNSNLNCSHITFKFQIEKKEQK